MCLNRPLRRYSYLFLHSFVKYAILSLVIYMNLPVRKLNRAGNCDYSQPGAYFITLCTHNRQPLFSAIVGDDARIVLKPYGKIALSYLQEIPNKYQNLSVDKYVIMPDHIHLLLQIHSVGEAFRLPRDGEPVPYTNFCACSYGTGNPFPTIGNVIGWYKYRVSKHINSLRDTPGQSVFQRSYYDHIIRNQTDYNEIWEYIENNPLKWQWNHQLKP